MLLSLTIQNVVLIDRMSVEFKRGLCVLTGETGAGKSILLDALGLALGTRAESRLVRKGAEQALVSAEFEVERGHPCHKILHNSNVEVEGASLILRRALTADGRSRAFINDQPVSAGLLRQVGESLVEIHGQFETQGLLNPETHGEILDAYAGFETDIAELWRGWKTAQEELEVLRAEIEKSRTQEDYLRQAVEDLDALAPQEGEEESLAALRERLMNRGRVMEGLNAAYHALNGDEDPVRKAWGVLDRIAGMLGEGGAALIGTLERASAEMQEALSLIQSVSADLEQGEQNLETVDERLYALRAQARKHGCMVDELPKKREELVGLLTNIERGEDALAEKIRAVEAARKAYAVEAEKVSALRRKAAVKLDALIEKELPPLKLDKARFVTQVEVVGEEYWGPGGMDRVRFLVATNPGAEPGPLGKIASGGEMARFMLALKVAMAEVGSAGTLIFDEVDSGIGGSTADAVGERLARLAKSAQVLVVTHSPQVAARAAHHWIVTKSGAGEVRTNVVALEDLMQRREEIARMLSGASITEEARAAAHKLLETGT